MKTIVLTLLLSAQMFAQTAQPPDPLQARVTIDFRDTPAASVIEAVASAAGLKVVIGPGALRPVTITLTNVKLGTALHAICDTALCSWALSGTLRITPLPTEKSALLPPRVSFSLKDTRVTDVFRALAAAINVPLSLDSGLPDNTVDVTYKNAETAGALNMLCEMLAQCSWDFDPDRGLRVRPKR
jgi:hypothetical protein